MLQKSDDVDTLVITGEGQVFSAGVDLSMIEAARARPEGVIDLVQRNGQVIEAFAMLRQTVVVALNGPAIGVAVHLALAGDFLLARRDAYFRLPEAHMGIPGVLHFRLFEQRLGAHAANVFCLLGERLDATTAQTAGLVGQLFDTQDDLSDGVQQLLGKIADVPRGVRRIAKEYRIRLCEIDLSGQVEVTRTALENELIRTVNIGRQR